MFPIRKKLWFYNFISLFFIFFVFVVGNIPLQAANINIGSELRVNVTLKSIKDLRDQYLVKQRYDYSCGSSALATLMRYGFNEQVTEETILKEVFMNLSGDDESLRKKEGLSLLDLQHVAQAHGYKAQGFRLSPEYLTKLQGPVIVFIKPRGYKHFAVLRGVLDDRIYLADPSRGNIRMPAYRFLDMWMEKDGKGIIFVIEPVNGITDYTTQLNVTIDGLPRPEIMSVRQLLSVGSPRTPSPGLLP